MILKKMVMTIIRLFRFKLRHFPTAISSYTLAIALTPLKYFGITIRTEIIANENLEILFCFRFRNGKANKFPHIFFRIRFRRGHVCHVQATTTGHTCE